jgi:hypothetical protein
MKRSAPWIAALLAAVGCTPGPRAPALVEAVDLTADLFHRTRAGIFRPDREPVVLKAMRPTGVPAPEAFFRLRSDLGSLWVKPDPRGNVVVHMDPPMFYSHWVAASSEYFSRIFVEWPVHPYVD